MAETGHQDVVNQVQSTDAAAPVDASASAIEKSTAHAAHPAASIPSDIETPDAALDKFVNGADPVRETDTTSREGHGDDQIETNSQAITNTAAGDDSAPASLAPSAESDTELSRNEGSDGTRAGETPKFTAKKPSAFKSISVTKNFLAKAGTPPSQLSKSPLESAGANAASSGVLAASSARPRLVAKTASGHKLSMSTQLSNGVKPGRPVGPDPMQVWNRNRVQTPQAHPKHLTDEELRQQYGIQLASIPIIDGDDKGNKWADIDDEEDDWAPEVIEWSDGSKVNLAEAEKAAADAKAAEEQTKREEAARIQQAAAKVTSSLGSKATVLKVGNASQAKSSSDNAAKPTDKPTLVAKPVAPAQVKSPWAALPPVEKVPPVPDQPTAQAGTSTQVPQSTESQPQASWRAAKEIAADDFSRMPRDMSNGMPRELFNSQSGKYEPVNDARRGSMKRDQSFRQHSVLQRPGQDQAYGPPGQVRESSDLTSDAQSQRASMDQQDSEVRSVAEQQQQQPWRRASNTLTGQAKGGLQSPILPSPGIVAPSVAATDSPAPSQENIQPPPPQEDAVTVQKRLMSEKIEAARKRKVEEAAREEAARQERIRQKLLSLGPSPEKKDKKQAEEPATQPQSTTSEHKREAENKSSMPRLSDASRSPPKPPAPGAAVQQYGMIKVHPSPVANGVTPVNNHSTSAADPEVSMERQPSGQEAAQPRQHGELANTNEQRAAKSPLDLGHREKFGEGDSRWNMTQKAWARAGEVSGLSSSSNLWAPSGAQRNLGNGDFNLTRGGPFGQTQISPEQILPSPRAPPATLFGEHNGISPSLPPQQIGGFSRHYESTSSFAPKSSMEVHPQPPSTQSRTPGMPSPIAPGLVSQHGIPNPPSHVTPLPEPKLGLGAWNDFSANAPSHDAAARARLNQDAMMRMAEAESSNQPMNRITERWKQTTSSGEAGSRRVVGVSTSTRNQQPGAPITQSVGVTSEEPRQPPVSMPPQHPKSSKFQTMFKQFDKKPAPVSKPLPPSVRSASPPLPPPDSDDHPVFDRSSVRPLVNLPGMNRVAGARPVPVVRLPPPKPLPLYPIAGEHRPAGGFMQRPVQPLAKTTDWQKRFNGLLSRSALREGGDFSISKTGFDILSVSEAAAVNFPQPGIISPTFSTSTQEYSDPRNAEESALFDDELHPGSTPPVRVPQNKYTPGWRTATVSPAALKRTSQLQLHDSDIMSSRQWIIGRDDFQQGNKVKIVIKVSAVATSKVKYVVSTNIKDPRGSRSAVLPRNGAHSKPGRKVRDASSPGHDTLRGAMGGAKTPVAAPSPAVPQTWAKRVSQAAN